MDDDGVSYSTVVPIMEVKDFLPYPKTSLIFILWHLGRIGWHSQAQKCLQINHKPFH